MILFFKPFFSSRPWHGKKLSKIYGCPEDTGEAWIVSGYHDKSSTILNGDYKGQTLEQLFNEHKEDLFGLPNEKEFPLLLKVIDADENLSVQVHPDNDYAAKRHNGNGKFECWYFLPENSAKEVVVGTTAKSREEMQKAIDEHHVMDVIKHAPLKAGDYMSIVPGTVHALKGGSLVLETQQPSDITYRLYDYDRKPARELHIEDSLNVIDFLAEPKVQDFSKDSYDENKYFTFDKFEVKSRVTKNAKKFNIVYIIDGEGTINGENVKQYDSLIVFSNENEVVFDGKMTLAFIQAK
jgi:mannose-6-phosphate isomerase